MNLKLLSTNNQITTNQIKNIKVLVKKLNDNNIDEGSFYSVGKYKKNSPQYNIKNIGNFKYQIFIKNNLNSENVLYSSLLVELY